VTRNAVKEIGWGRSRSKTTLARASGSARRGSSPVFTGTARPSPSRQGDAHRRSRIARTRRSFFGNTSHAVHVEMTRELIGACGEDWGKELVAKAGRRCRPGADVRAAGGARAFAQRDRRGPLAHWIEGLKI